MKKYDRHELIVPDDHDVALTKAQGIIDRLTEANHNLADAMPGLEAKGYKAGFKAALMTIKSVAETEITRLS